MAYTVPDFQYFMEATASLLTTFRTRMSQIADLDLLTEVQDKVINLYGREKRTTEMDNLVKLRTILVQIAESEPGKKAWAESVMLGALIYCKYRIAKDQLHKQLEPSNSKLYKLIDGFIGVMDPYKIKMALGSFDEAMRDVQFPEDGKGFAKETEFASRRLPEIRGFIDILSAPASAVVQAIQFITTMTEKVQSIETDLDRLFKDFIAFLRKKNIRFKELTSESLNVALDEFCLQSKDFPPAQKVRMQAVLSNKVLIDTCLPEIKQLKHQGSDSDKDLEDTKFEKLRESFSLCASKMARFSIFAVYAFVQDSLVLPQLNPIISERSPGTVVPPARKSVLRPYSGEQLTRDLNTYCVSFAKQFDGFWNKLSWKVVYSYRESFHRYYLGEFLKYYGKASKEVKAQDLDTVIQAIFIAFKSSVEGVLLRGVTNADDKYTTEQKARALRDLKTWMIEPGDLALSPKDNPWQSMPSLQSDLAVLIETTEKQARDSSLHSTSAIASMGP